LYDARLNFDRDFLILVSGMKMWWGVLVIVHVDDDAIESGNFGHRFSLHQRFINGVQRGFECDGLADGFGHGRLLANRALQTV